VAALVLAALLVITAAVDGHAQAPIRRPLGGHLLVATDSIRDPRFAKTVIYIVRHRAEGAFGLVINLPIGEVPVELALKPFGLEVPPNSGLVRVHYGGPVEERRGFVLHTADWSGDGTTVIDSHFAITEDPHILQAIAAGSGPRRSIFCLGYAGWGPGQLDAEMTTGAWGVAPADEKLVFDVDPNQKWIEATSRRQLDL
jgi:putative transcriptional regulator